MLTQMHIAKANAIEAKIEMELLFLTESNRLACLELIMALDAEDRIVYLNQYVAKVAAMQGAEEGQSEATTAWLLAA